MTVSLLVLVLLVSVVVTLLGYRSVRMLKALHAALERIAVAVEKLATRRAWWMSMFKRV